MADTRINALTTSTVSITDDFLPIDGTTAGTKKLSAYSPSFGGNATVGGTLTVNSTDDASNKDTGSLVLEGGLGVEKNIISGLGLSVRGAVTLPTAWTGAYGLGFEYGSAISRVFFGDGTGYTLKFVSRASSTTTDRMTLTDSGVLSVLGTTASTSTSSGALVVGNGTSGGLGVGGSIYAGANINSAAADSKIQILGTGNTTGVKEINLLRSDGGDACTIGLTGTAYAGVFAAGGLGNNEAFIYNASPFRVFVGTASTNRFDFTSSQFKVNATTASNNTSSGALVVSGGVGVAGAIVTGGIVRCGGSNGLSLGSDTGNIRIDSAGPAGVEFRGLSAADTITGFTMREMALIDGTAAPSTRAGYATIYVDTADGDLKVKFGDGTVKTIATDT
jgi:hypothetical protein